jgi:spore maturation protein CgeB
MTLINQPFSSSPRSPVVVFAGSFWTGSTESGVSAGFRDCGWIVQEVDQRDFGVQPSGLKLFKAAARLSRPLASEAYRRKILDECRSLKPDVFLTVKGQDISADMLRYIKETGARTVMYYPDVDFEHTGVSTDSFSEYDLFITTKIFHIRHLVSILGHDRVAHVPHGYCPSVHRPVYGTATEIDFETDVLHAGNHSLYKQHWLEGVARALPEVTLRVVGNRWRDIIASGPLLRANLPGARIGVAYAEAIQTARINVAVHMGQTASMWHDFVSTRTFEIPACGGFMLHVDNDEVREYFKPGKECDVFSSLEELADKINFYLARPELRIEMINSALARCNPSYSYSARAEQIIKIIRD